MVTYEEALAKARSLKTSVNYCVEYKTAYVFYGELDEAFGGEGECVIMKDTGDALMFLAFQEAVGEEEDFQPVREFEIKEPIVC